MSPTVIHLSRIYICFKLHFYHRAIRKHTLSTIQTVLLSSVAWKIAITMIQYTLNGSNTDGSFTVDDSNSFFSPYKVLPIVQENKYLGFFFSYFIMEFYVVCTHLNRLIEAILIGTLNIQSLCRKSKRFPKLSLFASWTGVMINPQWL